MFRLLVGTIIVTTCYLLMAEEYIPGRMIITVKPEYEVKIKKGASGFVETGIKEIDALNEYYGVVGYEPLLGPLGKYKSKWSAFKNSFIFFFADTFVPLVEVSKLYEALPSVRDAHPEYLIPLKRTPNDPMYYAQWYLPKCELPRAWNFTTGAAEDKLITAIDSGLDWRHPEINPVVWVNPGEDIDHDGIVFDPDDMNFIDDDSNGLVDDLIGYDFVTGAYNAYNYDTLREDGMNIDNDPMDFVLNGHGTACTGLFLAATDNNFGLASTNWNGKTIALRAGYYTQDSMGYNMPTATLRCLRYAIDMGAKIISLSYGSARSDPEERDMITQAWNAGCIIIAAAGNETTSTRHYPAAYTNVIAVGSTNPDDKKSDFSNYGSYVDIMAPGERMYMLAPGGGFTNADGTSFAAPLVAGITRLIWSYFPDSSRDWVVNRLLSSADNIDSLNPDSLRGKLGVGRVNAYKAIAQVIMPNIIYLGHRIEEEPGGNGDNRIDPGESGRITFRICNEDGWHSGNNLRLTVRFTEEDTTVVLLDSVVSISRIMPGDTLETPPVRFYVRPGTSAHRLYLRLLMSSSEGFSNDIYLPFIMIGRPAVLLYNASGDTIYNKFFTRVLDRGQIVYDLYERTKDSTTVAIISESELNKYRTVIWFTGARRDSTVLPLEQTLLTNFLRSGKQLLITGQNIGDEIGSTIFFTDILHAVHTDDNVGRRFMRVEGVVGDTIGDSLRFYIIGGDGAGNQDSPSGVRPGISAYPCFRYMTDTADRYAGIRYEDSVYHYKVVYLAFGFEAINSQIENYSPAKNVMARILSWMGYEFMGVEEKNTPRALEIMAYPNPFNSAVNVELVIPSGMPVDYTVYNLLGQKIDARSLGFLTPGRYKIKWDSAKTSGIYFMSVRAGWQVETVKLIYIK